MSGRHTPGPWSVDDTRGRGNNLLRVVSDSIGIANVRASAHAIENARLIAAAPDLLEACNDWIAWLDTYDWRDDAADYEAKMLAAMRVAIAKARGDQAVAS